MRSDLLDRARMLAGLRADDGEIGPGRRKTGLEVGEDAVRRNREIGDGRLHAGRIGIVDAGDLGVGMVRDQTQQVAHVDVIETDPEHAMPRHFLPSAFSRFLARGNRGTFVR